MKELPHITLRLQDNLNSIDIQAVIEEQWHKFAKSIVAPFLVKEKNLQTIELYLHMWTQFCYNIHFKSDNSTEYMTKSAFPDYTISASLIIAPLT